MVSRKIFRWKIFYLFIFLSSFYGNPAMGNRIKCLTKNNVFFFSLYSSNIINSIREVFTFYYSIFLSCKYACQGAVSLCWICLKANQINNCVKLTTGWSEGCGGVDTITRSSIDQGDSATKNDLMSQHEVLDEYRNLRVRQGLFVLFTLHWSRSFGLSSLRARTLRSSRAAGCDILSEALRNWSTWWRRWLATDGGQGCWSNLSLDASFIASTPHS